LKIEIAGYLRERDAFNDFENLKRALMIQFGSSDVLN